MSEQTDTANAENFRLLAPVSSVYLPDRIMTSNGSLDCIEYLHGYIIVVSYKLPNRD